MLHGVDCELSSQNGVSYHGKSDFVVVFMPIERFRKRFLLVIYLARFLINDFSVLTYGVAGKTATTTMLLKVNLHQVYEFNGLLRHFHFDQL